MKKMLLLALSIGLLVISLAILQEPDRAIGATKRASIETDEAQGTEEADPIWLNEAWNYRRPVVIHSEVALEKYQVLITLTEANFPSFGLIKTDGSDFRVTKSDGVTELYYWIEPLNSATHVAYVWVRLEPLTIGDTTLYLYYNNPEAVSTSNGALVFDLFDDDWTQFPPGQLNSGDENQRLTSRKDLNSMNNWGVFGTPVVIPPGILSLEQGEGILSESSYSNRALGFRANFSFGTGHMSAGFVVGEYETRTVIDDLHSDTNLYLTNYDSPTMGGSDIFEPIGDWHNTYHVYELLWRDGKSSGSIDHGISNASSLDHVPGYPLPATLRNYSRPNETLLVDWVYVRQYHEPEPTATIGAEQELVDLSIRVSDSPDPIQKGKDLTYLLTISNESSINASGVVVTDTLPTDKVIFVSAIPPACGYTAPKVICSLNTIAANSSTTVSIVVKPFVDGLTTNTANVASHSHELDVSDNTGTANTLVDTLAPNVNWVYPVTSGQKYIAHGSVIALEASAADNDQVAWVDFWYWDHLANPPARVDIGEKDFTYPYQMQFNCNDLVANSEYQVFAEAGDSAGNVSDIRTKPNPVIYVTRISSSILYLPITIK